MFFSTITDDWEALQFTGLMDRSGKEIYEGDIVKYKFLSGFECGWDYNFDGGDRNSSEIVEKINIVKFVDGEFTPRNTGHIVEDGFYSWRTFDIEVIGNIYENKDLISK